MNIAIIQGRLGKDPELKYTGSGKAVVAFSVAVDDGYGEKKTTEWFNVEAWDKLAEAVSRLVNKGCRVIVRGRFKTESWEQDGQKKYRTKVIAENISFIDFAEKKEEAQSSQEVEDADIPF